MAKKEKERKGKKAPRKRVKVSKPKFYSIEDGKIKRNKKFCTKCGPGVFMGEHKNRLSCGKCGYSEIITKAK